MSEIITITIRTVTGFVQIEVSSDDLVYRVMQLIREATNILLTDMRLIFDGQRLQFDQRLSDVGVVDGSILHLQHILGPYRRERDLEQLERFQTFLTQRIARGVDIGDPTLAEVRELLANTRAYIAGTYRYPSRIGDFQGGGGAAGGGGGEVSAIRAGIQACNRARAAERQRAPLRAAIQAETGGGAAATPPSPDTEVTRLLQRLNAIDPNWEDLLQPDQTNALEKYRDPITREPFNDPITIPQSGITYNRASLRQWMNTGSHTCPTTKTPLHRTVTQIDSMQPSYLVRDETRTLLRAILARLTPPPPIPTTPVIQQFLSEIGAEPSQRAPFQRFLRQQGIPVQSMQRQQLKKAWVRYKRLKRFT